MLYFFTSLRSASLLSGGDETEEGDEEEGCCEEDHAHSASSSTPDQSQSTTQDQVVAGEEAGRLEEGLSNDVPLSAGEEEPVEDDDPNDQSVDSIMADWQEDLEAFKQMENDEL